MWRAARQLHAALAGRVLTRTDFRVPRFATTDLTGRVVQEVVSRGKHILARVDGGVTIHTHLRMDGSWHIRPAGGYPPRDHRVRLVLANQQWQAIGYLLGVVEVLPTTGEDDVVGHLGPDLLDRTGIASTGHLWCPGIPGICYVNRDGCLQHVTSPDDLQPDNAGDDGPEEEPQAVADAAESFAARRLAEVARLHATGLLTDQEYQQKRQEIIRQPDRVPEAPERWLSAEPKNFLEF